MIRFSAGLVVVAIGVLIGGVATSKLSLVYVAIAVSAVALVALAIGVALKRDELFGDRPEQAAANAGAGSGMPVGQLADTGHVRGNDGPVREDQGKIRPKGPATAAFEAAAAARSEPAPTVATPSLTTPSLTTPSMTTPPVTAATVAAPPVVNPPLGQRQPAFSQASTREADSAADWQTRSPQPPWPSGDQGRSTWTPKETQSAPAPAAASPRGWGSSDEPPSPSWFDRLNQPVDDPPAPTTTEPTQPEPSKGESAKTEASNTPPAAEADDDDWPTRYSWLDDDESDETAKPDADVVGVTDTPDAAETLSAETVSAQTMPAKTVQAGAKGPEPTAAEPTAADDATTTPDGDAHARPATADDAQPADPADTPAVDAAHEDDDEPPAPQRSDVRLVTVIPGVPRYHDPDCILIRFMDDDDVARKSIPEAKAANCTPCAACQPEG